MMDVRWLVENLAEFDHVETIYKYRILSQKRGGRIYNYNEYLIHSPPGNYNAVLVFKVGDDYQLISTNITVYSRGTARYFSFTPHNDNKRLVLVLLKSAEKKT